MLIFFSVKSPCHIIELSFLSIYSLKTKKIKAIQDTLLIREMIVFLQFSNRSHWFLTKLLPFKFKFHRKLWTWNFGLQICLWKRINWLHRFKVEFDMWMWRWREVCGSTWWKVLLTMYVWEQLSIVVCKILLKYSKYLQESLSNAMHF